MSTSISTSEDLDKFMQSLYDCQRIRDISADMIGAESCARQMISARVLGGQAGVMVLHHFLYFRRFVIAREIIDYFRTVLKSTDLFVELQGLICRDEVSELDGIKALYLLKAQSYDQIDWPAGRVLPRLLGAVALPSLKRALDLACGTGHVGALLRAEGFRGHLTGVDITPAMLDQARARSVYDDLVVADLPGFLETAPGGFSLITMIWVSAHLSPEELSAVLHACHRGLETSGLLVFDIHIFYKGQADRSHERAGLHAHETREVEDRLKSIGFSVRYRDAANTRYFSCVKK